MQEEKRMLGVGMLFVGVTLISNGLGGLLKIDKKSLAVMNGFTGVLSFIINLVYLWRGDYYAAATGFLFAFTYLFVTLVSVFNLDDRVYGIFCLFVAINTVPCAYISFASEGDWRFAIIWLVWGALWLTGFIETVLAKKIGIPVYYFAIFTGIFTAWIPGFLMITELW
ncbi:hypothetical protein IV75_GL003251 [Carnobacterium maltaromaticum]|nr:hypothetical protein IV75_GL003251 [Carnobacterium maltaromaticum]